MIKFSDMTNEQKIIVEAAAKRFQTLSGVDNIIIKESNVNRIRHWVTTKEIAIISGWRDEIKDVVSNTENQWDIENVGTKLTTSEKKVRNRELKSTLSTLEYGITPIKGNFWERYGTNNQVEVREDSYFVVNLNDDPNFFKNIFELGVYYNQDAILHSPKGSIEGSLIGTNNCEYFGYGTKRKAGNFMSNVESEFMSRIGSMGFSFVEKEKTRKDSKPTFDDRKKIRTDNNGVVSNKDISESLDVVFTLGFAARHLCNEEARKILIPLGLTNEGKRIGYKNYRNFLV